MKTVLNNIIEIQKRLIEWGKINYASFPWRSTTNAFHALVAEVMLQRTKAEQVVPVFVTFAELYPVPKDVILKNSAEILNLLGPLGLRWRAKKIIDLSKELSNKKEVPQTFEELIALPGIGQYAACAYLSLHANVRAAIIDANAIRLWSRVFGLESTKESRRNKNFIKFVNELTPDNEFRAFNFSILDLTRTVCKQKPLCAICPIVNLCSFYNSN